MLEVYGAEADDIIAALCGELEFDNGKTLILSGDKDFIQLQRYRNVTQYSPITKKFVNGVNWSDYLNEHILRGDTGDGVQPQRIVTGQYFCRWVASKRAQVKENTIMVRA